MDLSRASLSAPAGHKYESAKGSGNYQLCKLSDNKRNFLYHTSMPIKCTSGILRKNSAACFELDPKVPGDKQVIDDISKLYDWIKPELLKHREALEYEPQLNAKNYSGNVKHVLKFATDEEGDVKPDEKVLLWINVQAGKWPMRVYAGRKQLDLNDIDDMSFTCLAEIHFMGIYCGGGRLRVRKYLTSINVVAHEKIDRNPFTEKLLAMTPDQLAEIEDSIPSTYVEKADEETEEVAPTRDAKKRKAEEEDDVPPKKDAKKRKDEEEDDNEAPIQPEADVDSQDEIPPSKSARPSKAARKA